MFYQQPIPFTKVLVGYKFHISTCLYVYLLLVSHAALACYKAMSLGNPAVHFTTSDLGQNLTVLQLLRQWERAG